MNTSDATVKALTMAVSGERKVLPAWSGNTSTLRAWLRQLSFWELDNQVPKHRWGVKLFQAFPEGSIPRRIAEGLRMEVVMSENGYGAILTAVLEKFKPYLDAAGPAAIDVYFYQGDRAKGETFANYISAKELARQEVESLVGERIPERIAGRVLLRQACLSEAQRETLAIKHNALLTFEEVAKALRPLDRPDALLRPMTSASLLANVPATSSYWTRDEEPDAEAVDPVWPEGEDPEDDEDKAYFYEEPVLDEAGEPLLYFEADREYDEEEALYIWAYNDAYNQIYFDHGRTEAANFPAYQDVRREMQARRKGRQFYRFDDKKGKKGKGRGSSSGRPQKGGRESAQIGRAKERGVGPIEALQATCYRGQDVTIAASLGTLAAIARRDSNQQRKAGQTSWLAMGVEQDLHASECVQSAQGYSRLCRSQDRLRAGVGRQCSRGGRHWIRCLCKAQRCPHAARSSTNPGARPSWSVCWDRWQCPSAGHLGRAHRCLPDQWFASSHGGARRRWL